jgi:hypothetical protein
LETLVVAISDYPLVVKAMHVLGNVIEAILDGEVSGLKPVHLGFWQICQVSFSSFWFVIGCIHKFFASFLLRVSAFFISSSTKFGYSSFLAAEEIKQSYDFTPRTDEARLSCCWCVPAATSSTPRSRFDSHK